MATTIIQKRSIRVPASNLSSPGADGPLTVGVVADILAKLTALEASQIFMYRSSDPANLGLENVLIIQCLITSANDTTLQGYMAGWAIDLGVALLDTDVFQVTSGHP
jgi:hypothetical protein